LWEEKAGISPAGQRTRRMLRSGRMGTALSDGCMVSGRYRVLRRLVSGGMGAVYEVVDSNTNRLRALKVMLADVEPDPDMLLRFQQEAKVAGRVESEHVVEVFDAGRDEDLGCTYLVMELLRGEDLGTRLRRKGKLAPEEALDCLTQVALGLERTHGEGIIHRDLKPENLFATRRDDGSLRMKILDFGIAKVVAEVGTPRTTRAFGTPIYMAPEQLSGDGLIDQRADLYALGHVAFTLLTGEPYFHAEQVAAKNVFAFAARVQKGAEEPASVRAEARNVTLPSGFDAWFERAAHVNPEERFDSASEQILALASALELPAPTVLGELPVREQTEPDSPVATSIEVVPRSRFKWLAVGLGVASVAVLGWISLTPREEPHRMSAAGSVRLRMPAAAPPPVVSASSVADAALPIATPKPAVTQPKKPVTKPRDPLDEL
jgi:serine/threonine protein kinase